MVYPTINPRQPLAGFGQRFSAWAKRNDDALLALGGGLLNHRQNATAYPLGSAVLGMAEGRQVDQQENESLAREKATVEYLVQIKGIPLEEARAIVDGDPAILSGILAGNSADNYKVVGDAIFNAATGEWIQQPGGGGPFEGNGLDAQALNQLILNGTLTPQQGLEVAAGKVITGPNGEMIFASPQALAGIGAGQGAPQGAPGLGTGGNGMTQLTAPKLSEDMRKVQGFADRAQRADEIISDPDVSASGESLYNRAASNAPFGLGNYAVSENYQKFDQAQRDFINAMLRRESGATILESEFANARLQYFPQPGDGPEVLAQKAENRRVAIEALQASAAPVQTFPGQPQAPGGFRIIQVD